MIRINIVRIIADRINLFNTCEFIYLIFIYSENNITYIFNVRTQILISANLKCIIFFQL